MTLDKFIYIRNRSFTIKGIQAVRIEFLLYIKSCQYSMFYTNFFSSTNNFAHAQTLFRMSSLCRSYDCMNIVRVNIGVLTGRKKIKQRRILTVELHHSFFIPSFFQEKTLGDISFKLETKIMIFMSVFF
jgi:hypothetical protein